LPRTTSRTPDVPSGGFTQIQFYLDETVPVGGADAPGHPRVGLAVFLREDHPASRDAPNT
jgi:hypothetical protein